MSRNTVSGNIVDIINEKIVPGEIVIEDGRIVEINPTGRTYANYITPGLIDAHVHVESSMLVPSEFARIASTFGTVATVSDPHEVANVLGVEGVEFMIENASKTPFKFYFGVPSCVPATPFESAGASLAAEDIAYLFDKYDLKYLSEMMNFPGVLNEFPDVIEKMEVAKKRGKPIDGHAPGLRGKDAEKYVGAGISTDHECFSLEEAIDKIADGMKVLIREGSAAKNFNELSKLIEARPDAVMLCSDDKHPDDLLRGHINLLVRRSLEKGYNIFKILRVAVLNPIEHYSLDVGALRLGDPADFIVVDDLKKFNVLKTYINGELVAENGKTLIDPVETEPKNNFKAEPIEAGDLAVKATVEKIRVIEAYDGQLITGKIEADAKIENGELVPDTSRDILKICVINRYDKADPAVAFIKGFGLAKGAIASSVAHDSHNIVAVGTSDEELAKVVNEVIKNRGGLAISDESEISSLPLPIAGIMSADDGRKVAELYEKIDSKAKGLGSRLKAPFMTLSFMALLVIPSLKLGDKGLFDGDKFEFVDVQL